MSVISAENVSLSTQISTAELRQFVIPGARAKGKALGRGAYGTVEEYHINGVPCAGKQMYDILAQSGASDVTRRYVEECTLMTKLRHPNVVQFLGVFFPPESALPVLLMERLTTDLDSLLENTLNIPLSLRLSFLTDVARGLAYLHGHRPPIIHRDLSARNILLSSSLVAKISDLGNSRIVNLSTEEVARLTNAPGCPVYMPPEISVSNPLYGPSLDVFSLGHMGLFTATQVFPDNLLLHNYPDPTNPRHLIARSEVERRENYFTLLHQKLGEDHSLVKLIKECLDNDPHQRPTAEQLVSRLEKMSLEAQSPQDNTAKLQLVGQLRQIEESELRHEVDSVINDREQLSEERRMLQSQLREKEEEIQQIQQELKDAYAQQSRKHSLFDPTSSSVDLRVRQCANIPIAMCTAQAVALRGKVYIGGGFTKGDSLYDYVGSNHIFIFDIRRDSWSGIVSRASAAALASYNDHLVLAGGWLFGKDTSQLWMLGEDNDWQQPIPPMPTPREQASAVGYGQHLIVAGGQSSKTIVNTVEVYNGNQWMEADPMPRSYFGMKSTVLNGTWYLTGGSYGSGMFIHTNCDNSVLRVNLQSLTERATLPQRDDSSSSPWSKLADAPNKLMAITTTGGGLLGFGGISVFGNRSRSHAYIYWPPLNSWLSVGKLPYYLHSTCAVTHPNGEVMLCGGVVSNSTLDKVYIVTVDL